MTRPSLAGIEKRAAAATEGPWSAGRGCVVAPVDAPNATHNDAANVRYYGGALIGESIARVEDRAFIADARTAVPALTAAVRDVLALHKPKPGWERVCEECVRVGLGASLYAIYPCPTVRAIAAHLDLTDPEGDPT